jgi:hypothetical protein
MYFDNNFSLICAGFRKPTLVVEQFGVPLLSTFQSPQLPATKKENTDAANN